MKLPFVGMRDKWEARRHPGQDRKLSETQRDILDAIDILEQRTDRSEKMSVFSVNGVIILGLIAIYFDGPKIAMAVQEWLKRQ